MRKNRMMRLASALLILTMVTTCAISGTFAKYVTSDSATDSARVAKFGVTVDVQVEKEAGKTVDAFTNEYGTTVKGEVEAEVLAPGTNATLCTVAIAGTPEVATKITADVDLELEGWTANGNYFPVIIKVDDKQVSYEITDDAAIIEQAVEDAVIKAIIDGTTPDTDDAPDTGRTANKDFGVNTSLAKNVTVTWEWPFDNTKTGAFAGQDDVKDTILGDAAATDTDTAATIAFTCAVTVEQVD